jgi:hypothetical protein
MWRVSSPAEPLLCFPEGLRNVRVQQRVARWGEQCTVLFFVSATWQLVGSSVTASLHSVAEFWFLSVPPPSDVAGHHLGAVRENMTWEQKRFSEQERLWAVQDNDVGCLRNLSVGSVIHSSGIMNLETPGVLYCVSSFMQCLALGSRSSWK